MQCIRAPSLLLRTFVHLHYKFENALEENRKNGQLLLLFDYVFSKMLKLIFLVVILSGGPLGIGEGHKGSGLMNGLVALKGLERASSGPLLSFPLLLLGFSP